MKGNFIPWTKPKEFAKMRTWRLSTLVWKPSRADSWFCRMRSRGTFTLTGCTQINLVYVIFGMDNRTGVFEHQHQQVLEEFELLFSQCAFKNVATSFFSSTHFPNRSFHLSFRFGPSPNRVFFARVFISFSWNITRVYLFLNFLYLIIFLDFFRFDFSLKSYNYFFTESLNKNFIILFRFE